MRSGGRVVSGVSEIHAKTRTFSKLGKFHIVIPNFHFFQCRISEEGGGAADEIVKSEICVRTKKNYIFLIGMFTFFSCSLGPIEGGGEVEL